MACGGHADPDAHYTLVGGANDVYGAFVLVQMGVISNEEAQAVIVAAAQAELGMIDRLGQAGANTVMVFNLFDLGLSPDIASYGPELAGSLSDMTHTYNQALAAGLADANINVIPVNMFALFNEFFADPSRYGFTDLGMPACGMKGFSLKCGPEGSGAPYTYAPGTENTHLFADVAHPGSAAHAMLAQYAQSIILAPGQISLLGEAPLAIRQGIELGLRNRIAARTSANADDGWEAWADYHRGQQRWDAQINAPQARNQLAQISLGVDTRPNDSLITGLALTAAKQKNALAAEAGSFELREWMVSGYANWQWQRAYFGANASIGDLDFNTIQRNVAIGPSLRKELGDTSGSHRAVTLSGGAWFGSGDWRHGPFNEIAWQRHSCRWLRRSGQRCGDDAIWSADRAFTAHPSRLATHRRGAVAQYHVASVGAHCVEPRQPGRCPRSQCRTGQHAGAIRFVRLRARPKLGQSWTGCARRFLIDLGWMDGLRHALF